MVYVEYCKYASSVSMLKNQIFYDIYSQVNKISDITFFVKHITTQTHCLISSKNEILTKIQRFIMILMRLKHAISHVPCKDLITVNALSQACFILVRM